MSPRTKRRRRRRKAIAGIVSLLRSEPRKSDPKYAAIRARSDSLTADLCFYAEHMKWNMLMNLALMTRSYDPAYAIVHPEL